MKIKVYAVRTTDVSPTNFSISLNERKAVEDFYKGVLCFDLQPLTMKTPMAVE